MMKKIKKKVDSKAVRLSKAILDRLLDVDARFSTTVKALENATAENLRLRLQYERLNEKIQYELRKLKMDDNPLKRTVYDELEAAIKPLTVEEMLKKLKL